MAFLQALAGALRQSCGHLDQGLQTLGFLSPGEEFCAGRRPCFVEVSQDVVSPSSYPLACWHLLAKVVCVCVCVCFVFFAAALRALNASRFQQDTARRRSHRQIPKPQTLNGGLSTRAHSTGKGQSHGSRP